MLSGRKVRRISERMNYMHGEKGIVCFSSQCLLAWKGKNGEIQVEEEVKEGKIVRQGCEITQ